MPNTILWQPQALRQLRKLQAGDNLLVRTAVQRELADLSASRQVKALVGHEYGYQLRVGRWRVLFDFDGDVHIVSIEEVRKRDERTY